MSSKIKNEAELIDKTSLGTSRIETFSDAVLAIAITLLVLEIKVPQLENEKASLTEALLKLWPSFGGYITSFLVIGIIWINHHQMYKLIERTNHTFLALNVLFLMVVSFLPFPTALLAEYLRAGREQQVATIFYIASMLAVMIVYDIVWRYASYKYRLINRDLSPRFLKSIRRKYNFGNLLYLLAFILSFINYQVSLGLIVFLALYFLSPGLPRFSNTQDSSHAVSPSQRY
jgi:uncharacterized membrane protein